MEIDISERVPLERECKNNNGLFKNKKKSDRFGSICGISIYMPPKIPAKRDGCNHQCQPCITQEGVGYFTCEYVPNKNNSQNK